MDQSYKVHIKQNKVKESGPTLGPTFYSEEKLMKVNPLVIKWIKSLFLGQNLSKSHLILQITL